MLTKKEKQLHSSSQSIDMCYELFECIRLYSKKNKMKKRNGSNFAYGRKSETSLTINATFEIENTGRVKSYKIPNVLSKLNCRLSARWRAVFISARCDWSVFQYVFH